MAKVTRRNGDGAQSEIIGAILLVVITLILASVLAVFVFDVGGSELQNQPPQVNFAFSVNTSDAVSATHDGGGAVDAENVEVVVTDDGTTPTAAAYGEAATAGGTTRANATDTAFGSGAIEVGDAATVATDVGEADEVRIVHIDPSSGKGTVLGRFIGN